MVITGNVKPALLFRFLTRTSVLPEDGTSTHIDGHVWLADGLPKPCDADNLFDYRFFSCPPKHDRSICKL